MGAPTQEMLDAVNELAAKHGWSPQDILTTISFETGGTMDPWQKGPTTKHGEHRGLIQWGEPQRKSYGVTKDMSVRDQVMAAGRYFKDRGVKDGDGLLPMYASINAGHASKIHASDEAAGGTWGSVQDKVRYQMTEHANNAGSWLDPNYVPRPEGAYSSGRSEDEGYTVTPPPPPEEPETFVDGLIGDAKGMATGLVKKGIVNALGLGPSEPMRRMNLPAPPPPPMRRSQRRPPVVLVKRKEKKKK